MKAKKTILTAVAAAAIAVGAQAQTRKIAPAGQDYTIGSVIAASGSNVTYQWFRNGTAIAGATSANYTVPANLAKMDNGLNVRWTLGARFQRLAYGIDCAGGVAMSNEVMVYFCELMVNGVCWARANSDADSNISSNPWDLGAFFQWNRPTAGYSATSPATGVAVSGWPTTPDYAATWTNGYPCPMGWRLPTRVDMQNLISMSQPAGGILVEGGVRGIPAGVSGRIYGYNTNYCTMTNMVGCMFLPVSGYRNGTTGALTSSTSGGRIWGSEQSTAKLGARLFFNTSGSSNEVAETNKEIGMPVRCVIDVQ